MVKMTLRYSFLLQVALSTIDKCCGEGSNLHPPASQTGAPSG